MISAARTFFFQLRAVLRADLKTRKWYFQAVLHDLWIRELGSARHEEPGRLTKYGAKTYSQFDEDGIISEIFNRIGRQSDTFIEIGVGDGSECNSLRLLAEGWHGAWIEGDGAQVRRIRRVHDSLIRSGALRVEERIVTAENVNGAIEELGFDAVDMLSVDIDGNDYWVWRAIDAVQSRLVVIEYNATWRPPLSVVVPYRQNWTWDGSNYFGASLEALAKLGEQKGYRLVACCLAGTNAFFVRKDLWSADLFLSDWSAANCYEPPRYYLTALNAGHSPRFGPLERI